MPLHQACFPAAPTPARFTPSLPPWRPQSHGARAPSPAPVEGGAGDFPTPSAGGSRGGGKQFRNARMETPSYTGEGFSPPCALCSLSCAAH